MKVFRLVNGGVVATVKDDKGIVSYVIKSRDYNKAVVIDDSNKATLSAILKTILNDGFIIDEIV